MVTINAGAMSGYDRKARKSSSEPDEVEAAAPPKAKNPGTDGDIRLSALKTGDMIGDMIEIAQKVDDGGPFLPMSLIQKAYAEGYY